MISPQYSWAFGRFAREISDKLKENLRGSLTIKIDEPQKKPRYSDKGSMIVSDLVEYIITIYDRDQSLGEIEVSNSKKIVIKSDKRLENITRFLETEYTNEEINKRIDKYANEDYSLLINEMIKAFAKLPKGDKITDYLELEDFNDSLWTIINSY